VCLRESVSTLKSIHLSFLLSLDQNNKTTIKRTVNSMSAIPQSFFNATIISAREWKIYTKKGKREREREREMHASSVGDHDAREREKRERERVNELEQKKGGERSGPFSPNVLSQRVRVCIQKYARNKKEEKNEPTHRRIFPLVPPIWLGTRTSIAP
jgi:hypothetical protein